jgi:energy-coupling factor transporter ATP-binding protein EcfA2
MINRLEEDPTTYQLTIAPDPKKGIPALQGTFGRITVLMGANGSGKSKILGAIRDLHGSAFGGPRPTVWIEGGRVVPIPSHLKLTARNVAQFSDYSLAFKHYKQKLKGRLSDRITDILFTLERRTEADKSLHSDAVSEWLKGGKVNPCPERDEPPLDKLFRLFGEVLPQVTLRLAPELQLLAKRGSSEYSATSLSDGEKQALAILADLAILAEPRSLILVDEPELNLHPLLAASLWGAIENDLPEAVFIYATHSLGFAMRRGVNRVIAVSNRNSSMEIGDPSSLDPAELRPFLGSIPAILTASKVLVVEGDDASFDKPFYQWLTGHEVEIVPIGNCWDVHAATSRTGIWTRLTAGLKIAGLIDRDYRSDETLSRLTCKTCSPLELHEAESYLCDPRLLAALAASLALLEPPPTVQDIDEFIHGLAQDSLLAVAAQRAFARATVSLSVSLPRQALAVVKGEPEMLELLSKESERETRKATTKVGPEEVEKFYREELKRCAAALNKNHDGLLQVFPGKQLLEQLAKKIGCSNSRHVLSAARKHIVPENFQELAALKSRLARLF